MVAGEFEQGLQELESMPETIETRVRAVPAASWEAQVFDGEGGWNRRQLLAHLASINLRHLTRLRLGAGLADAGGRPDAAKFPPIDEWNQEQVAARGERSVEDLLAELRTNRGELVALIRSLTAEQREVFRFPRGDQTLTLDEWIPFVLAHDRTHLAEITR